VKDYLDIIDGGTDDPSVLLRAARWVITSGLHGSEAMSVVSLALDTFGPETVYMDGELLAGGY
jgi:hypothetical protein